ncbi:hypothetical protein EVAR_174_1 [Eumeta japonica]|uniref:Uncharacterized protein n=1 Tax=Eumeta variegata TaxID=151549 RepID=A0A4C1S9S2_EUMVA|nr:hypothetical protein EVAR_174_1 [Eumeta japonica]
MQFRQRCESFAELRQAVWTFRGAALEETIEQSGEDWKSLHQLCYCTNENANSCVLIIRQDWDASLCRKGSGGDPG